MTAWAQFSLLWALIFYTLSFFAFLLGVRKSGALLLSAGLAANFLSLVFRYLNAWPMLPLYQAPVFLSFAVGILLLARLPQPKTHVSLDAAGMAPVLLMGAMAVFFPKDYYLPFIYSGTWLAHAFFFFSVLGKACFFMASIEALSGSVRKTGEEIHFTTALNSVVRWIIWGFAFLCISIFSGEVWSYLGWGSPVMWDDPAIASTMAVWCYYACFLHLHLSKTWTRQRRLTLAALGGALIFLFTAAGETGVFQWPRWQWPHI